MRSQIDSKFRSRGIHHRCFPVAASVLGYEHLSVCVAHQLKCFHRCLTPIALVAGLVRFLVAKSMTGCLDEFRHAEGNGNSLVAWSQSIAKGKTLRGMWFYCRPDYDRSCIWFHTVRRNVERALTIGLDYVDAGPSDNEAVSSLKTKYGFVARDDWYDVVVYEGPFHSLEA